MLDADELNRTLEGRRNAQPRAAHPPLTFHTQFVEFVYWIRLWRCEFGKVNPEIHGRCRHYQRKVTKTVFEARPAATDPPTLVTGA